MEGEREGNREFACSRFLRSLMLCNCVCSSNNAHLIFVSLFTLVLLDSHLSYSQVNNRIYPILPGERLRSKTGSRSSKFLLISVV